MKLLSLTTTLFALLPLTQSASSGSCSPTHTDLPVIEFTWALSSFIDRFYSQQPLNGSFLSSALNASTAEYVTNFQGIQRQNLLGVRAVQQLGSRAGSFTPPDCNFTFPTSSDGSAFVRNALLLEQSVCGALIGLAGYTESPEVSFLLARLAAEHTGHAAFLGSKQRGVLFPTNSTSLVPAYPPEWVVSSGPQPGKLGQFFHGCVSAPSSPCGQPLVVGPLVGAFGANASAALSPTGLPSSTMSPSSTHSPTSSPSVTTSASVVKHH